MNDIAILSGYFVRCPLGGYAWQILHYLIGLRDCGLDPYFYEDTAYYPDCFDPFTGAMPAAPDAGLRIAADFFERQGFGNRWIFVDSSTGRHHGRSKEETADLLSRARLLVSLAPVNRLPRTVGRTRVFVDLDPGFTQVKATEDGEMLRYLQEHGLLFTFGERIGAPGCDIPTAGFHWHPTRQPIATELWSTAEHEGGEAYTTIGRWNEARRDVTIGGRQFSWSKRNEWLKLVDLPARTGKSFRLAVDVDKTPADAELLRRNGWGIVDPLSVSRDPHAYRDFIRRSRGELTVAKAVTVETRSGWFSDRSGCYLAAGRPVVTQDTAFVDLVPETGGLYGFLDAGGAAAALESIESDYAAARVAARQTAGRELEARQVVGAMLKRM